MFCNYQHTLAFLKRIRCLNLDFFYFFINRNKEKTKRLFFNGLYCDVLGEIGLCTKHISVRLNGTVVWSPLTMRKALVQYPFNTFSPLFFLLLFFLFFFFLQTQSTCIPSDWNKCLVEIFWNLKISIRMKSGFICEVA